MHLISKDKLTSSVKPLFLLCRNLRVRNLNCSYTEHGELKENH
jgi:hypothetical protein